MSAERLRRVAAEVREYAEAADLAAGSDWRGGDDIAWCEPYETGYVVTGGKFNVAHGATEEAARHIAAWSPPVALAVADWLEAVADAAPISVPDYWLTVRAEAVGHRQALAFCDAWEAGR